MSYLVLTPSGRLVFSDAGGIDAADLPESVAGRLRKAFAQGSVEGLLQLATLRHDAALPAALSYWRRFGERYLTEICHVLEPSENLKEPLLPPADDLAEMGDVAPPMRGGEYLWAETLHRLWAELDEHVRDEVAQCSGGLSAWLRGRSPLWHCVGRVSFHLAENKRDPECPFAFLATYAPKLANGRRVQYQPLGNALKEYAGAKNKKALVNLLTPVQRASERCAWVKALVESGEVFHPLRWTSREAYCFLKDVPLLEESGLLARVPNWWAKRPARVRVSVSIGEAGKSRFNADSMLDFHVNLAVDGDALTQEEWQKVLASSDGLVFLKGRWVEVDSERLAKALEHWKKVEREVGGEGVSFIEGMRLLAGAPQEANLDDSLEADCAAWSEMRDQGRPWCTSAWRTSKPRA